MSSLDQATSNGSVTLSQLYDANGTSLTVKGATIQDHCDMHTTDLCDQALFPLKHSNLKLYRAFVTGGWSIVSKNDATASFNFPFGLPNVHSGPDVAHWIDEPQFGSGIWGYNPASITNPNPGVTWPSGDYGDAGTGRNIMYVPYGEDSDATAQNIANAVNGTWNINGGYNIIFPVSDYLQTIANDRSLPSNGAFVAGGNNQGAGFTFKSQSLRGMTLQVTVSVQGTVTFSWLSSSNDAPTNRAESILRMALRNDWTFISDPYSFYMVDNPGSSGVLGDFQGDVTVFCMTMPNSDNALHPHQTISPLPGISFTNTSSFFSLFFAGNDGNHSGFNQRPSTRWFYGATINGVSGGNPRLNSGVSLGLPVRQGALPLTPPNDNGDVILPVQLFMSIDGPNSTGPMYYVGDMWNCVLVERDAGPLLSRYVPDPSDGGIPNPIDAKNWRVLFKQDSPVQATVLIAVNDGNTDSTTDGTTSGGTIDKTPPAVVVTSGGQFNDGIGSTAAYADFDADGGNVTPSDGYAWTVTGLPGDWTFAIVIPTYNLRFRISGPVAGHAGKTFPLTVTATDNDGSFYTLQYLLALGTSYSVGVATTSLPNGHSGVPYNAALQGTGGSGNYDPWSMESGTLPPGLSFNAAIGLLSGTPTTPGTYSNLVFSVQDTITTAWSAPVTLQITVT